MSRKLVRTIVHLSDLHIAELATDRNGVPDSRFEQAWERYPWTEGFLGHSGRALLHLESFAREIKKEDPLFVITGDVTASGDTKEFVIARKFIRSTYSLEGDPRQFGLRLGTDWKPKIPGNHDHWPGKLNEDFPLVMLGPPTNGYKHVFSAPPFRPVVHDEQLATGQRLLLVGIDSDADVNPGGHERLLARGRFGSQLEELERVLATFGLDDRTILVLMLHHSPVYSAERWETPAELGNDAPKNGGLMAFLKALTICKDSRRQLRRFVLKHRVAALLTGHVHYSTAAAGPVQVGDETWEVLEARCGTTTVVDEWRGKKPRPLHKNTLLVHRLYETTNQGIEWETTLHMRGKKGFSEDPKLLPILRKHTAARGAVSVWPRVRRSL